jgi:hypothetical protein
MSRIYTCELPRVARTTSFDFFEVSPADDKPVRIVAIEIGQGTEVGDAAEEQIEWTIRRGGTGMTSGSGGTGSVAGGAGVGRDAGIDPASGFTYDAGNTTLATFTSGVVLWRSMFNVRTGLPLWTPPPEFWFAASQANGGIVVRCESTPGDSIDFAGTLVVEELP